MQEKVSGKKEELLERLFKTLSPGGSKVALCYVAVRFQIACPIRELLLQVALASPSQAQHNPLRPVGTEMIATPTAGVLGSTNEAVTPVDASVHVPKVLMPSLFGSAISLAPPILQPVSDMLPADAAAAEMPVPLSGSTMSTSGSGVAAASTQAALPKSDRAPRKPPMFSAWLQQPPEAIIKEARRLLATSPEDLRALKVHELKLLLQLKELKVLTLLPCELCINQSLA